MKALRIRLKQNKAHYRKPNSINNRLTYPLPPLSTIIGALHNACEYNRYYAMDISVQGKYESMGTEMYTNQCKLNSLQNDRGVLVKLSRPGVLSMGYDEIASATKSTGVNFMKEENIEVYNREIFDSFKIAKEDGNKKELEYFATIVKSPQSYEVLYGVDLLLHIRSCEEVLKEILDNIYNFTSLGRSEDFVDILEAKIVTLKENIECMYDSKYNHYIPTELIKDGSVYFENYMIKEKLDSKIYGTRYFIGKDYEIKNNIREFNLKDVMYISRYIVDEESKNISIDEDDNIVVFI